MNIHPTASVVVAKSHSKQPPAQAAQAAIADQPDLANQPFGKLVSDFARGVPLPSASTPENSTTA
jgi:hypothetical protein